jgi:hypothetical protein
MISRCYKHDDNLMCSMHRTFRHTCIDKYLWTRYYSIILYLWAGINSAYHYSLLPVGSNDVAA